MTCISANKYRTNALAWHPQASTAFFPKRLQKIASLFTNAGETEQQQFKFFHLGFQAFILARMDGVSGAASVITVITLAIQLGQAVQKINKFLRNVDEAPKEVVRLIEMLDQLHGTLEHVKELLEQQSLVLRLPGSPLFITRALEKCEKHIDELEILSAKVRSAFGHQRKLRRTWASMNFVVKKHDLEDIRCRLRDAKTDLQFAISSNSWQLQYGPTGFAV